MSGHCAIVPVYDSSASGVDADGGFRLRLQESPGCVTFPVFTGGLRGSFRPSVVSLTAAAQQFSSTAVYPPCPRTLDPITEALAFGHGGYTASGSAAWEHFSADSVR